MSVSHDTKQVMFSALSHTLSDSISGMSLATVVKTPLQDFSHTEPTSLPIPMAAPIHNKTIKQPAKKLRVTRTTECN